MVDIYKVDLTKDQLAAMPDDERGFFLFMGLAANEINCFSKLIIMTTNVREESEIIDHAHTSQAYILSRILFGKCYEALKFLKHSQVAARYKPSLPIEIKEVRRRLDRTFEQGGVLEDVRNISFHYPSADELNWAFQALTDNEPWCIYLAKANSNSLYYVSELVMQRAMLGEIEIDSESHVPVDAQLKLALDKALKNVFDTLISVADMLVKVFGAYNEILFEKYFAKAYPVPAVKLSAPDLNKVGIPFFVERKGAPESE